MQAINLILQICEEPGEQLALSSPTPNSGGQASVPQLFTPMSGPYYKSCSWIVQHLQIRQCMRME